MAKSLFQNRSREKVLLYKNGERRMTFYSLLSEFLSGFLPWLLSVPDILKLLYWVNFFSHLLQLVYVRSLRLPPLHLFFSITWFR